MVPTNAETTTVRRALGAPPRRPGLRVRSPSGGPDWASRTGAEQMRLGSYRTETLELWPDTPTLRLLPIAPHLRKGLTMGYGQ